MDTLATNLIATFGGSTAVARLTAAPVSTVQSWKHNGIPQSRVAHLQLIAEKEAIAVDWDTGLPARDKPSAPPSHQHESSAGVLSATKSEEIIRSADDRDGEGGPGHPFSSTSSSITSPPEDGVPSSPAPSIPASSRIGVSAPGHEADAA